MPALQPLTVQAAETKTFEFEPLGVIGGLATFQGTVVSTGTDGNGLPTSTPVPLSAILLPTMTVSNQRPSKTSRISKSRVKVIIPKPVLSEGVSTGAKSHENSVDVTFISSEKATDEERYELLNCLAVALGLPAISAVVAENKSFW